MNPQQRRKEEDVKLEKHKRVNVVTELRYETDYIPCYLKKSNKYKTNKSLKD